MSPRGMCGCVALVLLTAFVVTLELTLPWHVGRLILVAFTTSLMTINLIRYRRRKALAQVSPTHEPSSPARNTEDSSTNQ
jgi:hypothetical protein